MVDSSNNIHMNTFVGGMNLDVDSSILPANCYREAHNVRITTDNNGNSGVLHGIEGVGFISSFSFPTPPTYYNEYTVIHTTAIRDYGVLFCKNTATQGGGPDLYSIFRFKQSDRPEDLVATKIFGPIAISMGDKISSATRWEDTDNVKVYFADGLNPIRTINIAPIKDESNQALTDDSSLTIYPSVTFEKPIFKGIGTGLLKVGSVQYGYQLFNRNGSETEISVLTDMIQIPAGPVSLTQSNESVGAEKDESSGKSVKISVDLTDIVGFDGVKIVSVFYEDNKSVPKISVIANLDIPTTKIVNYEDVTGKALYTLTIEEFNMISGIHFIPRLLEVKNDHLFASDIKYLDNTFDVDYDARAYRYHPASSAVGAIDVRKTNSFTTLTINNVTQIYSQKDIEAGTVVVPKTSDIIVPYNNVNNEYLYYFNTYWDKLSSTDKQKTDKLKCSCFIDNRPGGASQDLYGGKGVNVRYRFVVGDLDENTDKMDAAINYPDNNSFSKAGSFEGMWVSNVTFDGQLVNKRFISATEMVTTSTKNYSNPLIAYNFKSLQRDEVYRYAVVFYNKYGQAAPAKFIGDIRTPSIIDKGFESFIQNRLVSFKSNSTDSYTCGLSVRPLGIEFELENLPEDVVAYEIVRCERKEEDRSSLAQGVIGKTMSGEIESQTLKTDPNCKNKIFPIDLLTLNGKYLPLRNDNDVYIEALTERYSNNVFTFASPDVCYNYAYFRDTYKNKNFKFSTKKVLASLYSGKADTKIKIVYPTGGSITDLSGTIYTTPTSDYGNVYSYLNQRRGTAANTMKMYAQSNAYNTYSAASQSGTRETAVGYDYQIGSQIFPKEMKWSDYKDRYDFAEPFNGVSFCNWCTTNLAEDKRRANFTGPGGRTMVAEAPAFGFYPLINRLDQAISNANGNIDYRDANAYANDLKASDTFSTLLCNLKQTTVPYGGGTYSSIENSTYIPIGAYAKKKQNNKIDVFGGDTYIGVFDYSKLHTFYATEGTNEFDLKTYVNYYIPTESSINPSLTFGPEYHRDKQGDVQLEPGNINNVFTQTKPLYACNPAYSAQSNSKFYTPSSRFDEPNKHIDVRTHFSQNKSNDELIDSWTKFLPLNYLDVDTRYGGITNIRTFGNELLYWQESAFGRYSVADRALITDDNVGQLVLGTGGILSRYDYITTINGMSNLDQDSDTQSDNTLYWYDRDKNEICAHTGGSVRCLSKLKYVQSYLKSTLINKKFRPDAFLVFDKKYNELLCCLDEVNTLVYNETLDVFTGFYRLVPDDYLYFDKNIYFIKSNSMYKYCVEGINSGFDGAVLDVTLNYVVNPNYNYVKVFDNCEFTGTFIKNNITSFDFNTENLIGKQVLPVDISNREYSYRFAIPRVNKPGAFANRLRGRALYCQLKYVPANTSNTYIATSDDEFVTSHVDQFMVTNRKQNSRIGNYSLSDVSSTLFELPYIKTTFRISNS